jgi:hypothetical protein
MCVPLCTYVQFVYRQPEEMPPTYFESNPMFTSPPPPLEKVVIVIQKTFFSFFSCHFISSDDDDGEREKPLSLQPMQTKPAVFST